MYFQFKLVDIGREKMGTDWKRPPYPLQNLTFQDIDNSALEFDPGRPLWPYKRLLNFLRQGKLEYVQSGVGGSQLHGTLKITLLKAWTLPEKLKIW